MKRMCSRLRLRHRYFPPATAILLLAFLCVSSCDLLETGTEINEYSNPVYRMFEGRLTYPTGEFPYEVLTGDLNGDGRIDLLTLNWTPETLSVLLATATGFAGAVDYDIGATPRAGVLADLTGNGYLDVAVVNETQAQVTLLLGDGTGGFSSSELLQLHPDAAPLAILAVDLNADGLPDLVTADSGTDSVTLFVNAGEGAFLEPATFSVGAGPAGLWAGDVTGNGMVDIVCANQESNTLSLLEFTGTTYEQTRLIPCGNGPRQVVGVDLLGNGKLDLVVGNVNRKEVSILRGQGEGLFAPETTFSFSHPVARLVVADLNGNSIPDLAATLFNRLGADRQPLSVFSTAYGDGAGGFRHGAYYGAGWGAVAATAADISGNGYPDLITGDLGSHTCSIAYNRGQNGFESDRRFPVGMNPGPALTGDFTQDGLLDLVVANRGDNSLSLLAGTGDGAFEGLPRITLPGQPLALAAGDLNGDGMIDLVVSLHQQARLLLYLGSGPGTFAPPRPITVLGQGDNRMPHVQSIALGDMNNNGLPDIVTGNSRLDSVSVILNAGAGQFETPIVTADIGNYPLNMHVADVNRDGFLDIVFLSTRDPDTTTDQADPRVVRWLGRGDGTFDFATHARFATGGGPTGLRMADVSGNGSLDAVTLHPGDNSVRLLQGGANGMFAQNVRLAMGKRPVGLALADVKRNGRADIITAMGGGSAILRFSRGDMQFEGPNNFVAAVGITNVLCADLNGDGALELILINSTRNEVSVLTGARAATP